MNLILKGYFGLGLSMAQLGDDKLVSFILGALVEIPGTLIKQLDQLETFTMKIKYVSSIQTFLDPRLWHNW